MFFKKENKKFLIEDGIRKDKEFKRIWERLPSHIQKHYLDVQSGKKAITLYNDVVFKKIFDPETRKNRLSKLLSLILGEEIKVLHSIENECTLNSLLSKRRILDVAVELENGEFVDVEIQVSKQEFAGKRAAVYSSDLVSRQYSVSADQKKSEFSYDDMKKVYCIILMKESPKAFATNPNYIHRFRQASDTAVELDFLQEYYFIELDKFDKLMGEQHLDTELKAWLSFLITDDLRKRLDIIQQFPQLEEVHKEVIDMTINRKDLIAMTNMDLELMERNSLKKEGRREAIANMSKLWSVLEKEGKTEEIIRCMSDIDRLEIMLEEYEEKL